MSGYEIFLLFSQGNLCINYSDRPNHKRALRFHHSASNTGGALSYIVRWENWYAMGNCGQERLWGSLIVITSNSRSILQQQFGENPGNVCCYSIYFDISGIVWLSRLLQQVSNDDTWACWCIILQNEQTWTKWIIVCSGENTCLSA